MKKNLLTLIIAFVPAWAMAQLVMTPHGLVNGSDGSNYLVIESDGDQAALYAKSMTYLQGIFNSPNHALSSVNGQSITVNGFSPSAISSKLKGGFGMKYDLRYSITFEFKEGRVRSQINSWEAGPVIPIGNLKAFGTSHGVWNTKMKMQDQRAKDSLETYFNEFFQDFETAINSAEDW